MCAKLSKNTAEIPRKSLCSGVNAAIRSSDFSVFCCEFQRHISPQCLKLQSWIRSCAKSNFNACSEYVNYVMFKAWAKRTYLELYLETTIIGQLIFKAPVAHITSGRDEGCSLVSSCLTQLVFFLWITMYDLACSDPALSLHCDSVPFWTDLLMCDLAHLDYFSA